MVRTLTVLLAIVALGGSALAQEETGKSLQLKDLPAAVQKTVQANLNGGEIKNIAKEKEGDGGGNGRPGAMACGDSRQRRGRRQSALPSGYPRSRSENRQARNRLE